MPRPPDVEREYFFKRAADHGQLAEAAADEGHRALHLQFVAMYRTKAEAIELVEQNQSITQNY